MGPGSRVFKRCCCAQTVLLREIADLPGPGPRSFGANVLGASAYDSEAMGYSAHWKAFGMSGRGVSSPFDVPTCSVGRAGPQYPTSSTHVFSLHRLPPRCAVSYL